MAATDAPSTLSELRTTFLDGLKEVTGVSAINTIADRYLNLGLQDMHQERWPWSERRSTIRTFPAYTAGTIAVAITTLTTRRTVTGTSTAWNTANSFGDLNAQAGMKMLLGSSAVVHLVSSVASDTSITLDASTPYTGTAALSGDNSVLYQDEYALASDFGDPVDVRFFDDDRTIRLFGAQELYLRVPRNSRRQAPTMATLIELGPSGSAALRRRIVVAPAPDRTYVIPYRYLTTNLAVSSAGVGAANLSAVDDQPIVPLAFRIAIVWKALELWFSTRSKNAELAADFSSKYATAMLRARQKSTNADDRPRLMPQVSSYRATARRPWRHGSRRYDGNAAFDELRF